MKSSPRCWNLLHSKTDAARGMSIVYCCSTIASTDSLIWFTMILMTSTSLRHIDNWRIKNTLTTDWSMWKVFIITLEPHSLCGNSTTSSNAGVRKRQSAEGHVSGTYVTAESCFQISWLNGNFWLSVAIVRKQEEEEARKIPSMVSRWQKAKLWQR